MPKPQMFAIPLLAAFLLHPFSLHAQKPPERCVRGSVGNATALLERAQRAVGAGERGDSVLRFTAVDRVAQDYQSDRPYPPYFAVSLTRDGWFDPATGLERTTTAITGQGSHAAYPGATLATERALAFVRDTLEVRSVPGYTASIATRSLNVFTMLHDWRSARGVRVEGECTFRDYGRTVLARPGVYGEERLYLDPKTGFPVMVAREEPHYLWGQVRVEYLYLVWNQGAGTRPTLPVSSVRIVDGETSIARDFGDVLYVPRNSAPALTLTNSAAMQPALPGFLQPTAPDTVRVGPEAFLLMNAGYTEMVAKVRDTVWVFDATQGEERARQDSAWVGRLFPGRHPVAVVVTDLAWPHVAGVRFWVASGANIVSHPMSRDFLTRVVERRWTRTPDKLERLRATARFRFTAATSTDRAGGGVQLRPIDGIGSEGALMAYLPALRLLWAGDYVQDLRQPSLYTREVVEAVQRAGFNPARVAAEHVALTPWQTLTTLVQGGH